MKVRTLPVVFILALTLSGRDLAAAVEPVRNESKRVDIADIADCMPAVDRGDVLTFRGLAGKEACRLYIQASFGGSGSLSPSRPDIPRAPNPPSSGNIMTPEECYKRFEAGEAIHYAGRTGRDACDFYLQYSMNQAQLSLQQEQLRQQQRFHSISGSRRRTQVGPLKVDGSLPDSAETVVRTWPPVPCASRERTIAATSGSLICAPA